MKVLPTNFNPNSDSGPNSFTKNLLDIFTNQYDISICNTLASADIEFCLIESPIEKSVPRITRLDGIYFNTLQDYNSLNDRIKKTYLDSDAVVFQSQFNKKLIQTWFGSHDNGHVILNGANAKKIDSVEKADTSLIFGEREIWMCASTWRPHKRLNENIRYFLQFGDKDSILFIAGKGVTKEDFAGFENLINKRIFYIGHTDWNSLISLYKASSHFIHLSFLDHCPNVVVDAAACGCKIICSSSGGTKEIIAADKTIVKDILWNYNPINLYEPPRLNFDNRENILSNESFNILDSASKYYKVMENLIENK